MNTIYALIMTWTVHTYGGNYSAAHYEHDFPTREACHAAYEVARDQLNSVTSWSETRGTCLKVDK